MPPTRGGPPKVATGAPPRVSQSAEELVVVDAEALEAVAAEAPLVDHGVAHVLCLQLRIASSSSWRESSRPGRNIAL